MKIDLYNVKNKIIPKILAQRIQQQKMLMCALKANNGILPKDLFSKMGKRKKKQYKLEDIGDIGDIGYLNDITINDKFEIEYDNYDFDNDIEYQRHAIEEENESTTSENSEDIINYLD